MSESAQRSEQLFTYQDYLTWPVNERWELLNKVVRVNDANHLVLDYNTFCKKT